MAAAVRKTVAGAPILPACPLVQLHDDTEWEAHRDTIKQKYIDNNETTLGVQRYMESNHGFKASIKQYERRFKKWGLRKNRTKADFVSIDQELKRKRLSADDTEVTLGGQFLSRKKVKRGISRHICPTLPWKWRENSRLTGGMTRTLNGLDIDQIAISGTSTSPSVVVRPSLREGKELAKVDKVPWFELADSIAQQLLNSTRNTDAFNSNIPGGSSTPDLMQQSHDTSLASRNHRTDELLATMGSMTTNQMQQPPLMAWEAHFVARHKEDLRDSVSTLGNAATNSITTAISNALYLLSNNLASENVRKSLVNMFQATESQVFAKALSSSNLFSARAVVSQLLVAACDDLNIELLEQLYGYGVDLDMRLPFSGRTFSALQLALRNTYKAGCPPFVQRLLKLGANPNLCHTHLNASASGEERQARVNTASPCCHCEFLPINQVAFPVNELTGTMIEFGARVCFCFNLTIAIWEGANADLVRKLLAACPGLVHVEHPGQSYWTPLQAASDGQTTEISDVLLDNGADVSLSSVHGLDKWWSTCLNAADAGSDLADMEFLRRNVCSPLALALIHDHSDMAARLLASGADPNLCYLDLLDGVSGSGWWNWTTEIWQDGSRDGSRDIGLDYDASDGVFTPLQAAIVSRSMSNVQLILDAGAKLKCKYGFQPLVLAAIAGENEILQMLLERGALVDDPDLWGPIRSRRMTALAYAAASGSIQIMKTLINAGADINYCDAVGGLTPLQAAVVFGAPRQCIELLLASPGIDVLHAGPLHGGVNAMVAAVINDDHIILDRLISHIKDTFAHCNTEAALAASPDTRCKANLLDIERSNADSLSTGARCSIATTCVEALGQLLHLEKQLQASRALPHHECIAKKIFEGAINSGQTHLAKEVLQHGAEIPFQVSFKLLHGLLRTVGSLMSNPAKELNLINVILASQASHWGNARGVSLVESALSAYYRCKDPIFPGRQNPVILSTLSGIVKTLVGKGFDVNSTTKFQSKKPLLLAVYNDDITNVCYFVEHGARINAYGMSPTHNFITPLQMAAFCGNTNLVDELIRHGAEVNSPPGEDGFSALGAACDRGKLSIIRKLIAAKADVNAPGNSRVESNLAIAASTGRQDIVLELIHSGANVNMAASKKKSSRTALQAACEGGHLEVVTILINNSADVNAAAGLRYGVTALQAAAIKGYFKICQVLLGCGATVSAPASPHEGRTAIDGAAEMGRLDLVNYLLDKYDGDEAIVDVCGKARWFARKQGHMVVDELLATYKQSVQETNPVIPPTLQNKEVSDDEDEETVSDLDDDDGESVFNWEDDSMSGQDEEIVPDADEEIILDPHEETILNLDDIFVDYGTN